MRGAAVNGGEPEARAAEQASVEEVAEVEGDLAEARGSSVVSSWNRSRIFAGSPSLPVKAALSEPLAAVETSTRSQWPSSGTLSNSVTGGSTAGSTLSHR